MKRKLLLASVFASLLAALPAAAFAADTPDPAKVANAAAVGADTVWVVVAAVLVMFMQAGFAMLEVGFSRMKNAGAVVAKVVTNFGVSSIAYWAVGFALAFGASGSAFWLIGGSGFVPTFSPGSALDLPAMAGSTAPAAAKFMFQFVFCAVSLAIVWGTMLERTKFIVYILFAIPFAAVIYPLISHQLFGGGWLQATVGAQDFAGSTVVHLTGAMAGFAGLLLLGPRIGKYEKRRAPNIIPGHNMPLAQLGVLILWFGWFGFNPGSTLNATNLHFADVVVTTQLAAAAGALAALLGVYIQTRTLDTGMIGNGAIAALVAITAPSGYVEPWAAIVIGAVAGSIVVVFIPLVDRILDDPVGCLSAHGLAGIWGTLSCGLFTVPALATFNGVGQGGLFYTGSFHQLGAQALAVGISGTTVFVLSFGVFWLIKKTVGLRVSAAEEMEGLDISEHGMWGYPEQFMPVPGGVYRPAEYPTVNPHEPERVRLGRREAEPV
ncbi:MAG TPA: ammonium transporter [Candidatus Dormibacteraeota bacterium]